MSGQLFARGYERMVKPFIIIVNIWWQLKGGTLTGHMWIGFGMVGQSSGGNLISSCWSYSILIYAWIGYSHLVFK